MSSDNFSKNPKMLIVGPSWVGDMVMAQSLFKILKDQEPEIQIDLLAPPQCEALSQAMPEISNFINLPFKHGDFLFFQRRAFGKSLRNQKYDQAIILPNSWKSALIPFFADIPLRTGYKGEFRYGLLNNLKILNKNKNPLMAQRFCTLGIKKFSENFLENFPEHFPKPRLSIPDLWIEEAKAKFHLNPADQNLPLVALCPGAEYGPAKKWPTEYYAYIAKSLREAGYQVWILGTQGDQAEGDFIASNIPGVVNLAGKTSLQEAMVILKLATQVITNDSGLMHIRAALDLPLIAIFGSTSAKFTPPLSNKAHIAEITLKCRPCFKRICPLKGENFMKCLKDLHPEKILKALELE